MQIIPRFSLNFNSRPVEPVSMLVLHYTGMKTGEEALLRLCDPAAQVSAHYLVEEDGAVYQLVEEEMRAWHAGVSFWRGRENINDISIGVEIVNPGHEFGYRPFPQRQMESVAVLCRDIVARHEIPARNVVAHSDIAPARKQDPGELFDWEWLAAQGVGLWPHPVVDVPEEEVWMLQSQLKEFGYGIELTGDFDDKTCEVITAFQRHFRPLCCNGQWDKECQSRLSALICA